MCMFQYFCNIPKLMQHLIISKMILRLQKMRYISGRFKERFLIIFCYYHLARTEKFNCIFDLAFITTTIFSEQNVPARS